MLVQTTPWESLLSKHLVLTFPSFLCGGKRFAWDLGVMRERSLEKLHADRRHCHGGGATYKEHEEVCYEGTTTPTWPGRRSRWSSHILTAGYRTALSRLTLKSARYWFAGTMQLLLAILQWRKAFTILPLHMHYPGIKHPLLPRWSPFMRVAIRITVFLPYSSQQAWIPQIRLAHTMGAEASPYQTILKSLQQT